MLPLVNISLTQHCQIQRWSIIRFPDFAHSLTATVVSRKRWQSWTGLSRGYSHVVSLQEDVSWDQYITNNKYCKNCIIFIYIHIVIYPFLSYQYTAYMVKGNPKRKHITWQIFKKNKYRTWVTMSMSPIHLDSALKIVRMLQKENLCDRKGREWCIG